jgi:hypothetical protein
VFFNNGNALSTPVFYVVALVFVMKDVFTVYGGSIAKDGTPTLSGAGTALAGIGAALFIG